MTPARQLLFALAVALLAMRALAQGPPPPPPPPPSIEQMPALSPGAARAPAHADTCDRCGKIESIHPVTAKDQWTPLGTVTSSALGAGSNGNPSAVTMVQIGPGFSNQGAVLIGAAGGAAYGTRPDQLNRQRWEIIVRMDAGGARAVTQNYEPMLREGDRVRVMGTQLELVQ